MNSRGSWPRFQFYTQSTSIDWGHGVAVIRRSDRPETGKS
jgi:hypothetical protein